HPRHLLVEPPQPEPGEGEREAHEGRVVRGDCDGGQEDERDAQASAEEGREGSGRYLFPRRCPEEQGRRDNEVRLRRSAARRESDEEEVASRAVLVAAISDTHLPRGARRLPE